MYDKSYVEGKRFKDKKCKHDKTAIYDGKFYKHGAPKAFKGVCCVCGLVSKGWAKVQPGGAFTLIF